MAHVRIEIMSTSQPPPSGIPLPGTVRPRVVVQRSPQPQYMYPHQEPLVRKSELHELEERNQNRYSSLMAAVVILGLLIIGGIIAGFIIIGLQTRNSNSNDGHSSSFDDDIERQLAKLEAWQKKEFEQINIKLYKIFQEVWDVKECTLKLKKEVSGLENTTDAIKECTVIIKEEVEDVKNCTLQIKDELNQVDDRTQTIKQDTQRMSLLPIALLVCAPEELVNLTKNTNMLISNNLADRDEVPSTSTQYNKNSGEIRIRPPNLGTKENVPINIQVRVLITEAGGPDGTQDSTYELILSTSPNCTVGDCDAGIYSTSQEYVQTNPQFGNNKLWMELNTNINVQGSETAFYVFMRSVTGNGLILPGSNDASPCATLRISIEALTPIFDVLEEDA